MFGSKRSRDMSKYYHFHEDYGHDTNDCRHLRTQIQEAVNSGQLSHLVKGIKKERTKSSDTSQGESRKDKGKAPTETPILMVSQEAHIAKSLAQEYTDYGGKEIIFPPVARVNNPPVIIEAKIFGRKVGRVYMDGGSSLGFSGERSWFVGEVPLEIKIGDAPLLRTKTLNFVIVRSDSPQNMLLGRTVMQRMGIVVSTIHGAIKFHTEKGIRTVLSTDEANEGTKRAKKIPATKLQNLLKSNADVFAWKHADMTRILRTIMVEGKPFNTEHKPNEYNHIKPIKQNKRGLGPDRNMATYKETEELTKAGILWKAKLQTWVVNHVMVKKSDGGWRMCVDFTHINKACPKDCYLLTSDSIEIESSQGSRFEVFPQSPTWVTIKSIIGRRKTRQNNFLHREKSLCYKIKMSQEKELTNRAIELGEHDIVFLRREENIIVRPDFLSSYSRRQLEKKEKTRRYQIQAVSGDSILTEPPTQTNQEQIKGTFAAKQASIKDYLQKIKTALRGFEDYTVEHVRRNRDKKADALSKLASITFEHLTKEVLVEVLTKRLIKEKEVLKVHADYMRNRYELQNNNKVSIGIDAPGECKKGHTSRSREDSMEHTFELTDNVPLTPHDSPLLGGHTPRSDEGRPNTHELMIIYTNLSNMVLALEEAKTAQDRVITRLKLRARRLERKRKARTPQPIKRRLFKSRVKTSSEKDKSSGEKGGSTADQVSTARPEVSAATPSTPPTTTTVFDDDEDLTIVQTLIKMRSKGVLDEEELGETVVNQEDSVSGTEDASMTALYEEYDTIQASIDADALFATRLQQEERAVHH
ncbi:reverse transcriptase domain-containing protein [Tanacetum coccineum]